MLSRAVATVQRGLTETSMKYFWGPVNIAKYLQTVFINSDSHQRLGAAFASLAADLEPAELFTSLSACLTTTLKQKEYRFGASGSTWQFLLAVGMSLPAPNSTDAAVYASCRTHCQALFREVSLVLASAECSFGSCRCSQARTIRLTEP